jgi:hypothetical protein
MDTEIDFIRYREAEDREERKGAMRDYCDRCEYHNESCPYYDEDDESWDERRCFRENEWW